MKLDPHTSRTRAMLFVAKKGDASMTKIAIALSFVLALGASSTAFAEFDDLYVSEYWIGGTHYNIHVPSPRHRAPGYNIGIDSGRAEFLW